MRNFMITTVTILLFVVSFSLISHAETILNADISTVKIFINNTEEKFKNPIVSINDVTYVPLREMNEKLNMSVNWDSKNKSILINEKDKVLYPFEADNGMWGYKDEDGHIIVNPIYYRAYEFSDGRALVQKGPGGNFGYIDNTGKEVIECKYFEAYSFSNGVALVYIADYTDADMWTYIDKDGNLLFDKTFPLARDFNEEYAVVLKEGYGFPVPPGYDIPKRWSYINKNGEFVTDMDFEEAGDFYNGYACVKNNGKWGVINNSFELVVPYEYENMKMSEDGNIYVQNDGSTWKTINIS